MARQRAAQARQHSQTPTPSSCPATAARHPASHATSQADPRSVVASIGHASTRPSNSTRYDSACAHPSEKGKQHEHTQPVRTGPARGRMSSWQTAQRLRSNTRRTMPRRRATDHMAPQHTTRSSRASTPETHPRHTGTLVSTPGDQGAIPARAPGGLVGRRLVRVLPPREVPTHRARACAREGRAYFRASGRVAVGAGDGPSERAVRVLRWVIGWRWWSGCSEG